MKQKEVTETFMMISNWKKPFGFHCLYKLFQRCKGWGVILGGWGNDGNPNLINIILLKWELKAPSH